VDDVYATAVGQVWFGGATLGFAVADYIYLHALTLSTVPA
jgi:hypothetical protein